MAVVLAFLGIFVVTAVLDAGGPLLATLVLAGAGLLLRRLPRGTDDRQTASDEEQTSLDLRHGAKSSKW